MEMPPPAYADFIDINTNFNTISALRDVLTTGKCSARRRDRGNDNNSGIAVIYLNGTPQVTNNLGSYSHPADQLSSLSRVPPVRAARRPIIRG